MAAWVLSRIFVVSVVLAALLNVSATEVVETEKVLTLDHSNFTEIVSKHDFIVVEFYAPWCGHCKALAPEYEKAASILSSQDPPIVLAKVDANEEVNRDLATQFQIHGFPTIKILRNGGKNSQDYKGPREADGIAAYLKKQLGPASAEIKSVEDASTLIDDKNVFIVGIFPKFSGEEFEKFQTLAEKLRSDYTFYHTLDAKVLPHGENVDKPTLRLLKPFDELVVDSQDFEVDAVEKFIKESTIPILTIWNSDPKNHPYINSFFESRSDKALLFVKFSKDQDDFQSVYYDVATLHKGNGISFLFGDSDVSQNAFQYFGVKEDQAPLLIVQNINGETYLKANIKPQEIAPWLKDYLNGQVKPFIKSEPIPEVNDEPVKVVVRDSLEDVVINSGKNVLIEFYAPWCVHCQKLAPILDEIATFFEKESDIIIAKFDATVNDIPKDSFDVQGFPSLYFRSSKGNLVSFEGDRTKEDIIEFIQNNRDKPVVAESVEAADSVKDEL